MDGWMDGCVHNGRDPPPPLPSLSAHPTTTNNLKQHPTTQQHASQTDVASYLGHLTPLLPPQKTNNTHNRRTCESPTSPPPKPASIATPSTQANHHCSNTNNTLNKQAHMRVADLLATRPRHMGPAAYLRALAPQVPPLLHTPAHDQALVHKCVHACVVWWRGWMGARPRTTRRWCTSACDGVWWGGVWWMGGNACG